MGFTEIRVTRTYHRGGLPVSGAVDFVLTRAMKNGTARRGTQRITARLDANGVLTQDGLAGVLLTANDDVGTTPSNVKWQVTERIDGERKRTFEITVPRAADGGTIELTELVPTGDFPLSASEVAFDAPEGWAAETVQQAIVEAPSHAEGGGGGAAGLAIYGDGRDGDHVVVGTEVLDDNRYYHDLTVPDGTVLDANGFDIRCSGTCTVEAGGKIIAGTATEAAGSVGGSTSVGGWRYTGPGGQTGQIADGLASGVQNRIAAAGGGGGDGAGGGGGASTPLSTNPDGHALFQAESGLDNLDSYNYLRGAAGGASGAGNGADTLGGGGGRPGGVVFLAAKVLVLDGTIDVSGGQGGDPEAILAPPNLIDDSGNGYNATIQDDPPALLDPSPWGVAFGKALDFVGAGRFHNLAFPGITTGEFCLEARVTKRGGAAGPMRFAVGVGLDGTWTGQQVAILYDDGTGYLVAWVRDDVGTNHALGLVFHPVADQEYVVAVDWDGTTLRRFVDGVEQGSEVAMAGLRAPVAGDRLVIGGAFSGNNWDGTVDEVRLSSVSRRTADYAPDAAPFVADADTLALYHVDTLNEVPGSGLNAGGGGGGGGGRVWLVYNEKSGSGAADVSGGAPGQGTGTGDDGDDGDDGLVVELANA